MVAIRPSGVPYERMSAADMVIVDLDGRKIDGACKPSSDLATHLERYRAFADIGGVAHTHSTYAAAWAQAGVDLPAEGAADAVHNAVVLEEVVRMAILARSVAAPQGIARPLLDRRFLRKHGPSAYCGQN